MQNSKFRNFKNNKCEFRVKGKFPVQYIISFAISSFLRLVYSDASTLIIKEFLKRYLQMEIFDVGV